MYINEDFQLEFLVHSDLMCDLCFVFFEQCTCFIQNVILTSMSAIVGKKYNR